MEGDREEGWMGGKGGTVLQSQSQASSPQSSFPSAGETRSIPIGSDPDSVLPAAQRSHSLGIKSVSDTPEAPGALSQLRLPATPARHLRHPSPSPDVLLPTAPTISPQSRENQAASDPLPEPRSAEAPTPWFFLLRQPPSTPPSPPHQTRVQQQPVVLIPLQHTLHNEWFLDARPDHQALPRRCFPDAPHKFRGSLRPDDPSPFQDHAPPAAPTLLQSLWSDLSR